MSTYKKGKINFQIDPVLKERFETYCLDQDRTMSSVLREVIRNLCKMKSLEDTILQPVEIELDLDTTDAAPYLAGSD